MLLCAVKQMSALSIRLQSEREPVTTSVHVVRRETEPSPHVPKAPTLSLPKEAINSVEKFIFFVGYGRSGHSIIASMMDAHPNMVIANEFYLFDKWARQVKSVRDKVKLFNELYRNSYKSAHAKDGWRTAQKDQKGYTLELAGAWQGKYERLQVIGDKAAGDTAIKGHQSPGKFKKMYLELQSTVQVPIQVIHIVRNPYDMIATVALYNASNKREVKVKASKEHRFNRQNYLRNAAKSIFAKADGVMQIMNTCHPKLLEIHSEEFILDPKEVIQQICHFLEVECTEEYLQKCYEKTFRKLSRSRDLVEWPPDLVAAVQREIEQYRFFQMYSFDDSY